jgi:hypothetical protein
VLNGIDESKIDDVLDSYRKAKVRKEEVKPKKRKDPPWRLVVKYLVHGVTFSLLFTVLYLIWILGFFSLVMLGLFIGVIIGFGLLVLIIGFVNSIITGWLWFPVKFGFWDILAHGFVLFLVLLVVHGFFSFLPSVFFPGTATTIITFIIGLFLDGVIGKRVGQWWEKTYPDEIPDIVQTEWRDRSL